MKINVLFECVCYGKYQNASSYEIKNHQYLKDLIAKYKLYIFYLDYLKGKL